MRNGAHVVVAVVVVVALASRAHADDVVRADEGRAAEAVAALEEAWQNRHVFRTVAFDAGGRRTLVFFVDAFDGVPNEPPNCNPDSGFVGAEVCAEEPPLVVGQGPMRVGVALVAERSVEILVARSISRVAWDWELEDVDGDGDDELTVRVTTREPSAVGADRFWVVGDAAHAPTPILRADVPLRGSPGARCAEWSYSVEGRPRFVRVRTGGRAIRVTYRRQTYTGSCQGIYDEHGDDLCECETETSTADFLLQPTGRFVSPAWHRDRGPF